MATFHPPVIHNSVTLITVEINSLIQVLLLYSCLSDGEILYVEPSLRCPLA
jgi:hypothetical protein